MGLLQSSETVKRVALLCAMDAAARRRILEYPEWQKAYREALLEIDRQKLPARIFAAEMAILARMTALQTSSDGHIERQAIQDALKALRVLQTKKLDYPAWEQSA